MSEILGVEATAGSVTVVHASVVGNDVEVLLDETWPVQSGARPDAYLVLFNRLRDFTAERNIDVVSLKASAGVQYAAKQALLDGAEVRGVLMAGATAGGASVSLHKKATLSRTFGERKVDDYVKDDSFWIKRIKSGALRKGSRGAAMMVLAYLQAE